MPVFVCEGCIVAEKLETVLVHVTVRVSGEKDYYRLYDHVTGEELWRHAGRIPLAPHRGTGYGWNR